MKKFGVLFLIVVAGFIPFLSGCGPKGKAKGTIGVSVLTMTNPFFKVIADTITEEAARNGFDTLVVSGEFNVARQTQQVRDFVVKGVDAIVLCPCDAEAIGEAIQVANDAGIPVFTADLAFKKANQPGSPKVVRHIATDNRQSGILAGKAMIDALKPAGGKVIVLDYKRAESCILRVEGFVQAIQDHTGPGIIQIVGFYPGDGQKDKGYKATEDALQRFPDLAGIFAINDPSALGARAALERAGMANQVKIIGFDAQIDGKQAIKEGKIFADPEQFPDEIGKQTVESIREYFNGEELSQVKLIETQTYTREKALKDPTLK